MTTKNIILGVLIVIIITIAGLYCNIGDNTLSRNAILLHEPPHHRIHIHHVLLGDFFIKPVNYHDCQKQPCP